MQMEMEITGGNIPSNEEIARYRHIGAQLQTWIDYPDAEGCLVTEATVTMQQLLDNGWGIIIDPRNSVSGLPDTEQRRMGLPTSDNGASLREPRMQFNNYKMTIGEGVIASSMMFRWDGPRWNELARAMYIEGANFPIETLRYVTFVQVINEQTEPLVRYILYPRRGMEFGAATEIDPHPQVWLHGTPEYQEMLGSPLGKAVAYLVLASFQRGTRRISRIRTFSYPGHTLCMTFEIE
ncbi:hypothetical protein N7535_003781 [Penicillium sp. DV-2018c]|nr:hypothetical protein N7461_000519 [Penicillium sp. DV-2018c]KAJ5576855.1 hypothetical protein N7535_003781 [Penicillium sp. DV-2018c]